MIINAGIFLIAVVVMRETRGSAILAKRARHLREKTGDPRYRAPSDLEAPDLSTLLSASITRAAVMLVREPVVLSFSMWLAYAWAIIFAFFRYVILLP